jgi:hypothetical protein
MPKTTFTLSLGGLVLPFLRTIVFGARSVLPPLGHTGSIAGQALSDITSLCASFPS